MVAGTGGDDGITVATSSSVATVWTLERGQTVTVTGFVRAHTTYDNVPRTVLSRSTIIPLNPPASTADTS